MRLIVTSAVALVALASIGCGGATINQQLAMSNPFPSRDALEKIAQAPVEATPTAKVATEAEWKVDVTAADTAPLIEKRFAEVAAKTGEKISYAKEVRCIAREMARFYIDHNANPDERLKRFMIAACGSTTTSVAFASQVGTAPATIRDEQLLADWQSKLAMPPEYRGHVVGVWMERKAEHVVVMTAVASPEAEVVVKPADAAGLVLVNGTAPSGSEAVIALMNQGDKGVVQCDPDYSVPLPLFAFRCPMAEADKNAWVEVAARAQGRLLLHSIGLALARRDVTAPVELKTTPRAAKSVNTPGELSSAVLDGVNRARTEAKLAPLSLAPKQSTTNERLAPHFFQAAMKNKSEDGDKVGLGLIAGWDVQGTIRNGNLFAALLSGTSDVNSWLDYALEMPMGRFTMLDAGSRQIAIGAAPESTIGGLGAVVTTYEFFGGNDHSADAVRVMERLTRLRAAKNLPQPVAIKGMKSLNAQATLVNAGQKEAGEALNEAMTAERDRSGRGVRGWVVATNNLDSMPFPKELLAAGPLAVGVEVTHFRPEGAAWGSYIVFFVMPVKDGGGQLTASLR